MILEDKILTVHGMKNVTVPIMEPSINIGETQLKVDVLIVDAALVTNKTLKTSLTIPRRKKIFFRNGHVWEPMLKLN